MAFLFRQPLPGAPSVPSVYALGCSRKELSSPSFSTTIRDTGESALRRLLKEQGLSLHWYEVMDALRAVRAIDLELAGQRYLVRTELGADAARVFQAAGVRPPSQVTPL